MSLQQIGEAVGLHASTVGYWLKQHGLRASHAARVARRGPPDRARLVELAEAGATLAQIAAGVDRSIATVRFWLDRWQIPRPMSRRWVDPVTAPAIIEQTCRRHGATPFHIEGRGYYRCMRCRQDRVAERRRRVKQILVQEAGGRCIACGYDACLAALQFHHLDRSTKVFELSRHGVARSLATARSEAAKCVLLCANCHAEVEAGHRELAVSVATETA